ncbi:hypothetical protein BGZ61DRAFT_125772 [Ilyonectria robusta]|uniref:uncharacterized protein n=1 Tax=Ilyonectria robusta TaxID=1079257 RepID=UPI001E8CAF55|nr:uncharacterized protein BGZ61DRAFT_125772 [Ilyonectria robusta]KAH8734543.1 hypothetical protein BGZ61DRAFT_125772 [Ilyonectria robusta]
MPRYSDVKPSRRWGERGDGFSPRTRSPLSGLEGSIKLPFTQWWFQCLDGANTPNSLHQSQCPRLGKRKPTSDHGARSSRHKAWSVRPPLVPSASSSPRTRCNVSARRDGPAPQGQGGRRRLGASWVLHGRQLTTYRPPCRCRVRRRHRTKDDLDDDDDPPP